MTADYGLKGEILYTKNASATLTISKRIIDGNNKEQFIDLGSSKLALDGQGTNPDPASANFLANIYYTYTTYYPSGSPYGDGENLFYQGYVFDNVRIFR
jgi:hypothetical protein